MWIKVNPNPLGKRVGDCVVRAVSVATGLPWKEVYDGLYDVGWHEADMPNSNQVWGMYLYRMGFEPFVLPEACPKCVTVKQFAKRFPYGRYVIGTGNHAVAVINGNYYDTWDSGNEVPAYFFRIS